MIPQFLRGPRSSVRIQNLSRREFLKQLGLASSGLVLGLNACRDEHRSAKPEPMVDAGKQPDAAMDKPIDYTELDTFVSIGKDGSVRVMVHRSEMGQGVRTSLAMLVAEELGASWKDVVVSQAPADMRYGDQNTDG